MSIKTGLEKGGRAIKKAMATELKQQGHRLTGSLEQSISFRAEKIAGGWAMTVTANDYQKYLNWGVAPAKASFKQFPFVVLYFIQRGLQEQEAKRAAAATIRKWMKEGSPTRGSFKYSKNGARLKFLDATDAKSWQAVDAAVRQGLDEEIDKTFHKTKSETI
jgi:hypothetical protein